LEANSDVVMVAPIDEIKVEIITKTRRFKDFVGLVFDGCSTLTLITNIAMTLTHILQIDDIFLVIFLLSEAQNLAKVHGVFKIFFKDILVFVISGFGC
jgi:hypothetical protein